MVSDAAAHEEARDVRVIWASRGRPPRNRRRAPAGALRRRLSDPLRDVGRYL